jgi:hypothetical protein
MAKRSVNKSRAHSSAVKREKAKILRALGADHGSSRLRLRLFHLMESDFAPHPDFLDGK